MNVSFLFQKQQTYWFKNWDFLKEFILLCHKILNLSYLVTAVNIFYQPYTSNKIIYLLFGFVSGIREQIQYSCCDSKRQESNNMWGESSCFWTWRSFILLWGIHFKESKIAVLSSYEEWICVVFIQVHAIACTSKPNE